MDETPISDIHEKMKEEIAFARALTALTMAISKDMSEIQSHRVEFRLKAQHTAIQSDLNRLAS